MDQAAEYVAEPLTKAMDEDPYVKTRGGMVVPFAKPRAHQIDTHDVLWALCNTTRFTGHTMITVGQHSMEVARFMMKGIPAFGPFPEFPPFELGDPERLEAGLIGFVHDFPETYIGDVSSPLKRVIKGDFRTIDDRFQAVVHARFDLEEARETHLGRLRAADMRCLYEDAIRFGMDGLIYEPTLAEDIQVKRDWVPEDFDPVLPAVVMSPRDAELTMWRMFTALMVQSGRGDLL